MWLKTHPLATAFIATIVLSAAAVRAADPPLRYRLEPGNVFGYAAVVEVQQAGRTEYHVGYPLFAVSATKNQATAVLALRLAQVKSAETKPSQPAEFHTEKISRQGGDYSLNEERRSFRYLPGSIVDQIFTKLPDKESARQWGGNAPFIVLGNSDKGYQENRYELLDSSGRFRETFVRSIQNKEGVTKEEWRGAGEVQFDLRRGLIAQREFSLTYSKPPGDLASEVRVKLSLRLLDEAALQQAARATSVRLPGQQPSAAESSVLRPVVGSGRFVHADTSFFDTQKLLAMHGGDPHRAQIVGELHSGQLCYRLEGSRAFWDGYLPPGKFQFIPGEINPSGGNVAMIDAAQRTQLLADLQGGDLRRASKAIEQLANLRPHEPDEEVAAAMITWLGVTDYGQANSFSEAMEHWATVGTADSLIDQMALPDGVVRRIAESGLTGIGPPAESIVAGRLQHHNPEVLERLLRVMGRIGTPQSLPILAGVAQRNTDKKITGAANFAAVEIRQRHGLPAATGGDSDARHREFERERDKMRADFDRQRAAHQDDFNRRVQEQRRRAEQQRKKIEADMRAMKARSRAGR